MNASLSASSPVPGDEVSFDELQRIRLSPKRRGEFAARAKRSIIFGVGRATVEVRCSRPETADAFAARYRDQPGGAPPDFLVFAVELDERAYFWAEGGERVWYWRHGALAPELAAFFLDNATMYEFFCGTAYLGFHAAVVATDGAAAALVGETTAGKTTTALACVRRGLRLYSDERCILEDGRVVPFLRRLTLRAGGRAALLADGGAGGLGLNGRLAEWRDLPSVTIGPRTLAGDLAGGPALPLRAVFIVESRGDAADVRASSASDAMAALLGSMASREIGLDRIARVLQELRDVRVFRMQLGSPDASARAIERELAAPEA